ncbi:MAG: hypothetical protein QOG63_809 [Thermoleophilaceae bacterium]|nr:hypothetical protein [Thermoleophilaceae bacterium]
MSALAELADAVDPALRQYAVAHPPPGRFAGERAFVLEAVYEGFLMHYREPRAFAGMDRDLRLLAGDALYALGLERLAQAGDLEAVAELSDLISLSSQAEAEGRRDAIEPLWEATVNRLAGTRPNPPEGA